MPQQQLRVPFCWSPGTIPPREPVFPSPSSCVRDTAGCDTTNDRAAELLFLEASLFSWSLYSAPTSIQTKVLVLRSTDRGTSCPVHYQLGSQTRFFSTKCLHPLLPLLTSTRPPKLNILLILLGLATAAVSNGVVREFCLFSVKIFQQKAHIKKERR